MNKSRHAPDIWLLIPILALLAIGMVMVYSAGSVLGFRNYGDSFYFVKRQMLFAGLGLIAMFITANTDYLVLKRFARPLLLVCFALLVLVLIPGIGVVRGGARSWLGIRLLRYSALGIHEDGDDPLPGQVARNRGV